MKHIQVYDPPMCCSSGVCGSDVDPALPVFAGMLQQLKNKGVAVERYNLTQQPLAFVQNAAVKDLLDKEGVEALPLVFCDGKLVLKGAYPDREQRTEWMRAVIDAQKEAAIK
jgi:hypothetical protein